MSKKKQRKEEALLRSKKRKKIIITVCAALTIAVVALIVVATIQYNQQRVFADRTQRVTLGANGSFNASLPHGVNRSGTFTETPGDGFTIISFSENGTTATGTIEGNILNLPAEWDDGCGHNPRLEQIRGRQE